MPKKYVHTTRGKTMQYSQDNLLAAVNAVNSGALSLRKAAERYSVPRSTISDRVSGRLNTNENIAPGRKPALPKEVEDQIVSTVKLASQRGMGITRKQLLKRTGVLCKKLKVPTPMFSNGTPGNGWWEGLKRRYPSLTIRKPEKLGANRARALNGTITGSYFEYLEQLLDELNLKENPDCIWNADETGIQFEHNPVRVIAEKGVKSVVGKTSDNRSNITIMACGSAAGARMPPMVIVKGKTSLSLHGFNTEAAPPNTKWAFQEKGWMTDELGEVWFKNVFLEECGPRRPQLLVLDRHSSHESLAILEIARSENIHILCLPPHCTHFLQPLDRTVFGPFKTVYSTVCSEYLAENCLNTINKWSFPGLFRQAFETAMSKSNLQNGFKACGIHPFNPSCLPKASLQPSAPTDKPLRSPASTSGTPMLESSASMLDVGTSGETRKTEYSTPKCPHKVSLQPSAPTGMPLGTSASTGEPPMLESSPPMPDLSKSASTSRSIVFGSEADQSTSSNYEIVADEEDVIIPECLTGFIDNPEQLLELLNTGMIELIPDTLSETGTASEGIAGMASETTASVASSLPSPQANWNSEIENIFLPTSQAIPSDKSSSATKTAAKKTTKHRLLTSDDVVKEKRIAFEKKCQKEEEKLFRKIKKEEKLQAKLKK